LVACELKVLAAIVDGEIAAVETCSEGIAGLPPSYGAAGAVEALLRMGTALRRSDRLDRLLARVEDARPEVAAPALAGLADVDDLAVGPALRRAVAREDVGVQAAAAAAIAARSIDGSRRDPEAVSVLVDAVRTMGNATAIEARIAAIEALGNLAVSVPAPVGRPKLEANREQATPDDPSAWLTEAVLPLAADPNAAVRRAAWWALRARPPLQERFASAVPAAFPDAFDARVVRALQAEAARVGTVGLRLHTSAGVIEIVFAGAPAPITRGVLVSLVREGYFDGLSFHRVVPAFVIQGGDPRGDGYGGPGFVLPCERSSLRYVRGAVGMALAGKDTGGSQLFVAQSSQPHLDARYTIVGYVHDGMDVVDAILPYDVIERAEVIEAPREEPS
jgi:cyclophilin family peptidyl-prolyl cis-trans isomerase